MAESKIEYMKKYNKSYYEQNKAKILEDAVKKVRCEACNIQCSKSNMSKHMKTDGHKLRSELMAMRNPVETK